MKEMIKLNPVFKTMVWGGNRMRDYFGYEIPGENTGEAWVVSAHPQGDCLISEGMFAGKSLSWLWKNHRELFGNIEGEEFPLLVKFIDAKEDLSIQVHPDDTYAEVHENGARGKTECWYILDCEKDADIIVGHQAKTKEEMKQWMEENRWEDFLKVRPIHPGDFFQIPPGTVHAIRKGTLLIEIQQNSAITYRMYDYGRMPGGKLRELHLNQALDVVQCPHEDYVEEKQVFHGNRYDKTFLVSCPFYTVEKYDIRGALMMEQKQPFLIVSIIDGEGMIDENPVKKGACLILPDGYGTIRIKGNLSLVTAHIGWR
ncbi:MAG: class I mannose-6-phosphate isomerase [Lachnospiraceae bacterium]|nr:class I mannose-6-phosphate isomerase [Lachnospiraceae bacterium]